MKDTAHRGDHVPRRRASSESEEHWLDSLDLERSGSETANPDDFGEIYEDHEFIDDDEEALDEEDAEDLED